MKRNNLWLVGVGLCLSIAMFVCTSPAHASVIPSPGAAASSPAAAGTLIALDLKQDAERVEDRAKADANKIEDRAKADAEKADAKLQRHGQHVETKAERIARRAREKAERHARYAAASAERIARRAKEKAERHERNLRHKVADKIDPS